jgi:hypothetical protein
MLSERVEEIDCKFFKDNMSGNQLKRKHKSGIGNSV